MGGSSKTTKKSSSKKSSKKLNHVFDAINELESEDFLASKKRRKITASNSSRTKAAQSQTKIYNHLVECRILFQRAMQTTITPPNIEDGVEELSKKSMKDITKKRKRMKDQCDSLLETLLEARNQLVVNSGIGNSDGDADDSDEKHYNQLISDQQKSDNDNESSSTTLNESLEEEYTNCRDYWKSVLNRRHKDLKLHAGITAKSQFKVIDSSFWNQVESNVEYEQMMRTNQDNNNDDENNNYVFDDSKVYQQLLKEFVASAATASSSTNSSSSTTNNNHLLKNSKAKKSDKKDVDRRASKGRKIRYKEIPKLQSFTFPLSRPATKSTNSLDQDEWFQSLFGGAGRS